MWKAYRILIQCIPLLIMVGLIPLVQDDSLLSGIYGVIIGISFALLYTQRDWIFFLFGLSMMTLSEYFFTSTGVEVFQRHSLFGLMPLWLPLLWGYGFVAIRRGNAILES